MTHRLLIAAALGEGKVDNIALSEDIKATLRCITALGGQYDIEGNSICVTGIPYTAAPPPVLPRMDCGESGSTLRFFIPIALALAGGGAFIGHGRLMERPQKPYFDLFKQKDIFYELKDNVLTVRGNLTAGIYQLPGNVSSQFFTGLLFALSRVSGKSTIISTTQLESADYITMTIAAMKQAGVSVIYHAHDNLYDTATFEVQGQSYQPLYATVEGDWSQAAFWYAANMLGSEIILNGLDPQSVQGDRVIQTLADRLSCFENQDTYQEIDISNCPDLLPPLAVIAAARKGITCFINAGRLRMKESDRLTTVCQMLRSFGVNVEVGTDFLKITGSPVFNGGEVDGANDHRIVMAAAVAACNSNAPVIIRGAEAVNKSYPDFFEHYQLLGGKIDVF